MSKPVAYMHEFFGMPCDPEALRQYRLARQIANRGHAYAKRRASELESSEPEVAKTIRVMIERDESYLITLLPSPDASP
jgi:hypothetical protein